jgi:hypothetical protein
VNKTRLYNPAEEDYSLVKLGADILIRGRCSIILKHIELPISVCPVNGSYGFYQLTNAFWMFFPYFHAFTFIK